MEINLNDLKGFLAVVLMLGFHDLPSYTHAWTKTASFYVHGIAETMSRDRFTQILTVV
jgi:hypothetical protein